MSEDNTKSCVACAREIPVAAKLCHICKTYQDYRRAFNISGNILSLLIALFSVTGLASTHIIDALNQNNSHISFSQPFLNQEQLFSMVQNGGGRHGLLTDVILIGGTQAQCDAAIAELNKGNKDSDWTLFKARAMDVNIVPIHAADHAIPGIVEARSFKLIQLDFAGLDHDTELLDSLANIRSSEARMLLFKYKNLTGSPTIQSFALDREQLPDK